MLVVVCVQKEKRSVDVGGSVCRKKKEMLMSVVVCVQKEKGSVGGGLCAERKRKC